MAKKKKPTKSTIPAIPQLSLEALDDVQKIERYARQQLIECESRSHFNTQKAERILRTCTVQVLKAQLAYYESLATFHEDWISKLQEDAIESAVGMVPGGYDDELYDYFRNVLWDTTYADLNPPLTDKKEESPKHEPLTRKEIRDAYLHAFPYTKILDICWAAGQHYSEWKRWLRNAVKDGSAPDRAFRTLLSSSKEPTEYRKQPRPKGWK